MNTLSTLNSKMTMSKPALSSTASISWTTTTSGVSSSIWYCSCWSPEKQMFAAGSKSGTIMTSSDGYNWTQRTTNTTTDQWYSICWSPTADSTGLFVAVAPYGNYRVITSPDGVTWTLQSSLKAFSLSSVCWSDEKGIFVAVATGGTGSYRVMTSSTGKSWTQYVSTDSTAYWRAVCWGSTANTTGLFVAIANNGKAMYSSDGTSWSSATTCPSDGWTSVAWSPSLSMFVAMASYANAMYSTDGMNWTLVPNFSTNFKYSTSSICWSPEKALFLCPLESGSATVRAIISSDGLNWVNQVISNVSSGEGASWSPSLSMFIVVVSGTVWIGT